ncbi:MAG: hypothetical protein ABW000_25610 [Actinoplanes sp.]
MHQRRLPTALIGDGRAAVPGCRSAGPETGDESPAGDTGGAGGGLPVTGGDVTGLILVAAMFFALGTGLFIASRRGA